MKKFLKITGIILGVVLLLLLIGGLVAWIYAKNTFLEFEEDYVERTEFETRTEGNYAYLDRNGDGQLNPYEDDRLDLRQRVADALQRMTVEEKIHLLKGSGIGSAMGRTEPGEGIPGAVGTIVPTPRLGLPTVYLSDGPAGLRIQPTRPGEDRTYYATAFPIATQLASTWNVDLVERVGEAMGREARAYGLDVLLGPGVNLHRHPLTGRNFEYFSEDPLLSGKMGAAIVNGIEANGVGTSPKHFVANNQETQRNRNDARVSERALRELYLRNFRIIVEEAQPWTIMSSYNKVNGTYASESPELLTDVLRGDWGFEGLVMSDWFGGTDAVRMIRAGNDLLEPGTKRQWDALLEAHEAGTLSEADIDRAAARILALVFKSHKMRGTEITNDPDLDAHTAITRQSAAEGIVLLKNDAQTLPVSPRRAALFGTTSFDFIAGGTGSGDVNEAYTISLAEGLQRAGFDIAASQRLFDQHRDANAEAFEKPEGITAILQPYTPPPMTYNNPQIAELVVDSELGIYTIGRNSGEFTDRRERDDFLLTDLERSQLESISAAYRAADKPFVVVLNVGGVVEIASWRDLADAIVLGWQGGQEGGNAVADVLTGAVNPSGRLPMTFPVRMSDHASNAHFPTDPQPNNMLEFIMGTKEKPEAEWVRNEDYTDYAEGIYIGYRHFDTENIEVAYPFGFGLSYTDFSFGEPEITTSGDTVLVTLTVANTGSAAGREVVQIYAHQPGATIERAAQELVGFVKTPLLEPGASVTLTLPVPENRFAHWDGGWQIEPGVYELRLGRSSREVLRRGTVTLGE